MTTATLERLVFGAIVFGLCGCGGLLPLEHACTDELRYGISVTVVDSATGQPPDSALLVARTREAVDSMGPVPPIQVVLNGPPMLILSAAPERAGTYNLTVRASGYRDWNRTGVQVTRDACHVRATKITARLQH